MGMNVSNYGGVSNKNLGRATVGRTDALLRKLNSSAGLTQSNASFKMRELPRLDMVSLSGEGNLGSPAAGKSEMLLHKLNSSGSFTQIGDMIKLNDGTSFKVSELPKLDIESFDNLPTAKGNVMDFGSGNYFKYTTSDGKNLAIYSMPDGALMRPLSEYINGYDEFDLESERYMHFWNNLKAGQSMMLAPGNPNLPSFGYSLGDIRGYLDEAGISKGFFSVKVGSHQSDFFYSNSKHNPLYKKSDYDWRYETMTSSDFSYNRSVFNCLEPGTEITIAGEKYTLKDDFTLDIPYGIDIFDIEIPKHTFESKVPSGFDCRV